MSKDVYIVSTMSAPVSYCFWGTQNGMPHKKDSITINGGAHIPSTRSGFGNMVTGSEGQPIWTADGICTRVTEEQYAKLKTNKVFMKHIDKGFLSVVGHDVRDSHRAVKRVVADMTRSDPFTQLTPETYGQKIKIRTKLAAETDFRI